MATTGIKVSVLCPQAVRTAMTAGNEDGVASVDGMMEPEELAEALVKSIAAEEFLILPHPQVLDYMRRKTAELRPLDRRDAQAEPAVSGVAEDFTKTTPPAAAPSPDFG